MQASKFRRVRVPPIESPVTRRKVGWRLLIVILAVAGVLAAGCGGEGNGSGGEYEQNGVHFRVDGAQGAVIDSCLGS